MVFLTTLLNSDYVTTPWAVLGTFDNKYANSSLVLVTLNFAIVLAAVSTIERAFIVKICQPEFYSRAVKFFIDQLPYEVGKRFVPLERTPPFIVFGSFLHFLTWCVTVVFVFYGICIMLEAIETLSPVSKYATIVVMTLLPKTLSLTYEFHDMKTQNEIPGEWKPEKWEAEKVLKQELVDSIKSRNLEQSKTINEKSTEKRERMPYELAYQQSDDRPSAKTPFNHFTPADSSYISVFHCQMLWKELTSSYLTHRERRSFQEEAVQRVMDVCHAYDDYETEVVPQRLLIVDQWLCEIKAADR
ncbi:unnamed protein product [Enterobius vermicularis]|uniref:Neur_chan_memb domain-containing protein n=1 Tax=Enterobius vermicularis TaxID=51028 RepID=A0A0N4VNB1_ENTVE|nr:unnamed protein product [Enterobius vermicularis]